MYKILNAYDANIGIPQVAAHCDIPCKIYDPMISLVAALSVVRLMDIMHETMESGNPTSIGAQNTIARCVIRKEEEAEKVKQEVRVTWGDYFKAPQIEQFPNIHELAHKIMMKASNCKQEVSREDGLQLVELVNEFSTAFWKTKGIEVERKVSPYPPSLEIVYPVL